MTEHDVQKVPTYERPSIATLSADDIWALIGPVQGYLAGGGSQNLPSTPLDAVDHSTPTKLNR